MTINWQEMVESYNEKFTTHYQNEKEMWNVLYPRFSCHELAQIFGVDHMTILERLREKGIKIEPRGHRHPTKLDKFKAVPRNVRGMLSVEELTEITGASPGTIVYYRIKYGG